MVKMILKSILIFLNLIRLNEEIEKIVDGVKSSNISRCGCKKYV